MARAIMLPFIAALLVNAPAAPTYAAAPGFVQVNAVMPQSTSVVTV
jgi:hypothetical protein